MYFTNTKEGIFTDGIASILPGCTVQVEKGKETAKMDAAWRKGWLDKSETLQEGAKLTPLIADKPVTVATNSKPKTTK